MEIYQSEFKRILDRESSRQKIFNRKKFFEENGGTFSKEDVKVMFQIQEEICYFCGESLSNFHVDHFQPLFKGGRNDISNIVLTCQSCNLNKEDVQDGFTQEQRKSIR